MAGAPAEKRLRLETSVCARSEDDAVERKQQCCEDEEAYKQSLLHEKESRPLGAPRLYGLRLCVVRPACGSGTAVRHG